MASRKESGAAPSAVMASVGGSLDSPVKQIQIEGLVSGYHDLIYLYFEVSSVTAEKNKFFCPQMSMPAKGSIIMAESV